MEATEPRQLGWWVEVRKHPPKLLPVEWGFWKRRYVVTEPASVLLVRYFKEEPKDLAEPEAAILCDSIEPCSQPCIVTLCCGGRAVEWLRFLNVRARNSFASALHLNHSQDLPRVPSFIGTPQSSFVGGGAEPRRKHGTSRQPFREQLHRLGFTAMRQHLQMRQHLEAKEQLLCQKETELATREEMLHAREAALATLGEASSCLETPSYDSSSEEEESCGHGERPFGSSVVMDWPLSRAEKHLRLVTVLDRQRILSDQHRRRFKERRRSAPPGGAVGDSAASGSKVTPRGKLST